MAFTRGNLWAGLTKARQAAWLGRSVSNITKGPDLINGEALTAINAAGTGEVELIQADSDDVLRVGKAAVKPLRQTMTFHVTPTAKLLDQVFFIVPYAMTIEKIQVYYDVVNTGAFTGQVTKMADGVALASGTAVHTALDLTATARTVYTATLSTTAGVLDLVYKDRLGFDFVGSLSGCAGITVTITFSPGGKGDFAVFYKAANAEIVDQSFHLALYPKQISSILYAHTTLGTNGSAVTAHVEKDVGTEAAGGGTTVMTGTFDCKAAINTVQVGVLAATADLYRLKGGDRLSVDITGTTTALAGVVIVVLFDPDYSPADRVTVNFKEQLNADMADTTMFIADQNYEIVDAGEVHTTAFSGAVNILLTRDVVLDAPGAGTDINSGTADGFQGDGTADTVQKATFGAFQNFLLAGDRIGVDYTATTTGVGMLIAVALKPC